jgi:hypothetical protein
MSRSYTSKLIATWTLFLGSPRNIQPNVTIVVFLLERDDRLDYSVEHSSQEDGLLSVQDLGNASSNIPWGFELLPIAHSHELLSPFKLTIAGLTVDAVHEALKCSTMGNLP